MNIRAAYGSTPQPIVTRLLGSGVPLSLLLDVFDPTGPSSREIFEAERP